MVIHPFHKWSEGCHIDSFNSTLVGRSQVGSLSFGFHSCEWYFSLYLQIYSVGLSVAEWLLFPLSLALLSFLLFFCEPFFFKVTWLLEIYFIYFGFCVTPSRTGAWDCTHSSSLPLIDCASSCGDLCVYSECCVKCLSDISRLVISRAGDNTTLFRTT